MPPDAIHASLTRSAGWALLVTLLVSLFYPVSLAWYGLAWLLVVLGLYFAAYLLRLQQRTALVWAARREMVSLLRQGIIWGSVAYFLTQRGQSESFGVLVAGTVLATGLGLFIMNRLNPRTLDELRAHRELWKALLHMRAIDAFLMRFPCA